MHRRVLAVAAVLAVGLAVAAGIVVATRDDRDPIVKRADDAVGDRPVLHLVVREQITGGKRYSIATGRTRPVTSRFESWVDPERRRVHAVQRSDGEVLSDQLIDMTGLGPAQTTATLVADFRRRLGDGELRVARAGTIDGRKVRWLASTAETPGVPPFEAAVDAETYRLVRIRTIARYLQTTRDLELVESVARDDADFLVRFGAPTVRSQTRPEGRRVDPSEAARTLDGAQWAGEEVGGLRLREVRASGWRVTLRPGGTARGVMLTVAYGADVGRIMDPAVGTPTGVEIVEAADDSEARWFLKPKPLQEAPPPAGTFDLGGEFTRSGQFFLATLRKPGVWILVRAPNRTLLLSTVRALRPIS